MLLVGDHLAARLVVARRLAGRHVVAGEQRRRLGAHRGHRLASHEVVDHGVAVLLEARGDAGRVALHGLPDGVHVRRLRLLCCHRGLSGRLAVLGHRSSWLGWRRPSLLALALLLGRFRLDLPAEAAHP